MQEHLERLIQQLQETHLVENLMNASSLAERVKICEEARGTAEFEAFEARYNEVMEELDPDNESALSDTDFECTEDNAVAVAMILVIANIDDVNMFDDYDVLIGALMGVNGEQEKTAKSIAYFLSIGMITDYELEEFLEKIF